MCHFGSCIWVYPGAFRTHCYGSTKQNMPHCQTRSRIDWYGWTRLIDSFEYLHRRWHIAAKTIWIQSRKLDMIFPKAIAGSPNSANLIICIVNLLCSWCYSKKNRKDWAECHFDLLVEVHRIPWLWLLSRNIFGINIFARLAPFVIARPDQPVYQWTSINIIDVRDQKKTAIVNHDTNHSCKNIVGKKCSVFWAFGHAWVL